MGKLRASCLLLCSGRCSWEKWLSIAEAAVGTHLNTHTGCSAPASRGRPHKTLPGPSPAPRPRNKAALDGLGSQGTQPRERLIDGDGPPWESQEPFLGPVGRLAPSSLWMSMQPKGPPACAFLLDRNTCMKSHSCGLI